MRPAVFILAFAVAVSSCFHVRPEVYCTHAGITFRDPYGDEDCEEFGRTLDRDMDIIRGHIADAPERLQGWYITRYDQKTLATSATPSGQAYGLTWCSSRWIQVTRPGDTPWCRTALAHELIHAAQCGDPRIALDPHAGWFDGGWEVPAMVEANYGCNPPP